MGGNHNIYTGGGNYNESIQGNYIQGNYVHINQDLSESIILIQQLLNQIQFREEASKDEQQKAAYDLVSLAQKNPEAKGKLVKLSRYLGDAAANGLIGQAAVEVFRLALGLLNIPLL